MAAHPVIKVPKSRFAVLLEIVTVAVLIATVIYLLSVIAQLPERIPVHFKPLGEADRWGGKGFLFVVPAMGLVMYAGMTLLSKYPHAFNYLYEITAENARRQYAIALSMLLWIKLEIMILFGFVEWQFIRAAQGGPDPGLWFLPVFFIFFAGTLIIGLNRSARAR